MSLFTARQFWLRHSKTNRNNLQLQQNNALPTVTGCVKITNIDHLHNEAEMLPVKEHSDLLAQQFLAGTYQCHRADHHTAYSKTKRSLPRRCLRRPGQSTHQKQTRNKKEYRLALKKIHKHEVREYLKINNSSSKVLNTSTPKILEEESKLPRYTRVKLAQVRSGYSRLLNSYLSRIYPDVVNCCPKCGIDTFTYFG